MNAYQRSADVLIGLPWNIAYYALFASMLAHHLRYKRGILHVFLGDAHIYNSHSDGFKLLDKIPLTASQLQILSNPEKPIEDIQFEDITLSNTYCAHESLKLEMAV